MSVVIRLKVPIEMHYTVIPMGTSKVNSSPVFIYFFHFLVFFRAVKLTLRQLWVHIKIAYHIIICHVMARVSREGVRITAVYPPLPILFQ